MSKAFNSSLSCLAMFVALSIFSDASTQAAPQASNISPKDSSVNLSTASLSSNPSTLAPTSISNLIDRQEAAVTLQNNLSVSSSSTINLEVDKLVEQTEVSAVTSVSQLSDVRPTDWAFTALQSLVERYGCIAGYPNSTFLGGKALARYEFAAGLNACLDKINEIISAGLADKVSKEDLATLRKLQEEFAAELATLRGRIDTLDKKVATLEAQQFSTTTKLSGLAFFNITGATASAPVRAERSAADPNNINARPTRVGGVPSTSLRNNPNVTFGYYLFLTLTTSFTGKDALVTQLVTGNGNSPANNFASAGYTNSWGTPFLDQTGVPTGAGLPGANSFNIRELFYSFPVASNVNVVIGPRINFYRYFDGNRFTNFLTGATSFNSNGSTLSNAVDRGSGAVVSWTINPQFKLTAAYLGENTEFLSGANFNTSSNPQQGLFGGTNTITAEMVYSPSKDANFRFLYTRSNIKSNNDRIAGATAEPLPYGIADDGQGGGINNATADTIILNFDWLISKGFGIFGRYSYGSTNISPLNPAIAGGSVNVNAFQFGLGFPDLFKEGALGVLSFVVPHSYSSGRNFLVSGGGDGATQYDLEMSYYYPISKNIAIVPAFYAIFNPNSFSTNPTVFVGNLRTQFSF
jgi:hypothetical protein